jgi:hypothetical protein
MANKIDSPKSDDAKLPKDQDDNKTNDGDDKPKEPKPRYIPESFPPPNEW